MFIRIAPPHYLSDRIKDAYVPLKMVNIKGIKWEKKLKKSVNAEDVLNDLISESMDPGNEKEKEVLTNQLVQEVNQGLTEIINILQPHVNFEINTNSKFEIVSEVPKN
jgi:hypothetical protein